MNIEIPNFLSHLKVDKRGYPIPFFVPIVNGLPEFLYMDGKKVELAIDNSLCHICGFIKHGKIYVISCLNSCFYYNPKEEIYVWYYQTFFNKEESNHVNLNIVSLPELFTVLSTFKVKFNLVIT